MIFFSSAEQVIKESIQNLKWRNHSKIMELRDEALDYYTFNNTAKYIDQYFGGTLQQEIPLYNINLTKKLINRISLVYKDTPIRNIESDNYESYAIDKDWKMKSFERIHNLLGTLPIHIGWNENKFVYNPIINFEPIFDEMNPLEPIGLVYILNKRIADINAIDEDIYVYWTKDQHFMFDTSGRIIHINEEDVNPYGVLPFVFLQPNSMVDEFFNEGAMDIALGNKHIDIAMTMLQHQIRSSGGQYVIEGRVDASNIQLGLNKVVVLDEGGMKNISSNIQVSDIMEGIKFQLQTIAYNNNINFDFGLSGSKSGVALKLENLELLEAREDEVEKFRRIEKQMYNIEKVISQTETGVNLPEDFSVDFTEVQFPDPERELQEWDWKFKHGLADKYDYLMHNDPDKFPDRETAIKYLEDKKVETDTPQNIFTLNRGNNGENTNNVS